MLILNQKRDLPPGHLPLPNNSIKESGRHPEPLKFFNLLYSEIFKNVTTGKLMKMCPQNLAKKSIIGHVHSTNIMIPERNMP